MNESRKNSRQVVEHPDRGAFSRSATEGSRELFREILTTAIKLGRETGDKADLKLVNTTLKELRYSFKIFSPYRNVKKAIMFGSARSKDNSAEYKMAEEFAGKITRRGFMVVTGGGPGVMEAGNRGTEPGKEDLDLYCIMHDVDQAVKYIEDFYKVYHSIRYVRA